MTMPNDLKECDDRFRAILCHCSNNSWAADKKSKRLHDGVAEIPAKKNLVVETLGVRAIKPAYTEA